MKKMQNEDKVFLSFMVILMAILVSLVVFIICTYNVGFRWDNTAPEPGQEKLSLVEYMMSVEAVTIRQAPSGKVYHVYDTVDLNDYLGQIDSLTDWNYTEGDEYTDSILTYYGVYWDEERHIWSVE